MPDPSCCGIAPNAPRTVTHRWLQYAKKFNLQSFVHSVSGRRPVLALAADATPAPRGLRAANVSIASSCWGLARCGHHDFSDGRSARHSHADPLTPCRFCTVGMDSLEHALFTCSAHQSARQRWMQQSGGTGVLSLHRLFSTDPCINSARDMSGNIAYVDLCRTCLYVNLKHIPI